MTFEIPGLFDVHSEIRKARDLADQNEEALEDANSWVLRGGIADDNAYATNTTLGAGDHFVMVTAVCTITLPNAGDFIQKEYIIKATSSVSGVVTIATTGSDTIDGSDTITLHPLECLTVVSPQLPNDGWTII